MQIPSSQIESIEVINNPSTKYDARKGRGHHQYRIKEKYKNGWNGNFTMGMALNMMLIPE